MVEKFLGKTAGIIKSKVPFTILSAQVLLVLIMVLLSFFPILKSRLPKRREQKLKSAKLGFFKLLASRRQRRRIGIFSG
jgi:hypothetical protein